MIFILLFFLEILVLWSLSRYLNQRLIRILPFWLYAVLFLPGTLVHELSHLTAAKLLGVHVGRFSITPKKFEREVILGSVAIEKTGIVKRAIIGVAPLIFGVTIILTISFATVSYKPTIIGILILGYFVFVIANSMFSSKKDLDGIKKIFVIPVVLAVILYFSGAKLNVEPIFFENIKAACLYLSPYIFLNSLVFLILKLFKN